LTAELQTGFSLATLCGSLQRLRLTFRKDLIASARTRPDAVLRTTGLTAPPVVDEALNGALVVRCVRHHLIPTLTPDAIVVMDHLGAHEVT
jgi:hypothetical protein